MCCSDPIAGNHNDCYELSKIADKMLSEITKANIRIDGLFLNADAGFDTDSFRKFCNKKEIIGNIAVNPRNGKDSNDYIFDTELYKDRFVIERTNAWIDAFKALLIRFETKNNHWKALHTLAFITILIR